MHAEYGNHDEVAKILREAVEMESMNRDEGMDTLSLSFSLSLSLSLSLSFSLSVSLSLILSLSSNSYKL